MSNAAARWRLLCLVMLGAFLALGFAAFTTGLLPGDVVVRQEVLNGKTGVVYQFAKWINYAGAWPVLLPGMIALFALSPAARRRWWLWCVVMLGSGAIQHIVKFSVGRPRPSGHALGFPSGHTTAATTFAVLLIYFASRERLTRAQLVVVRTGAVIVMILVGWARIRLNAHWPSDVLGGFLLGTCCVAAAAWWETARENAAAETGPGSHA